MALPPLAEQRRIVAKLGALTDRLARARADLDRIPRLAAQVRDAAISEMARIGARSPARGLSEFTVSFDGPFGSALKSDDYVEQGVRVVRLENIGRLKFISEKRTFVSEEKFQSLRRHTLESGDVLFSSFIADEVRVCVYQPVQNAPSAINKADCFAIRVQTPVCHSGYLAYVLASEPVLRQLMAEVHGATRPRVSLSQLRALRLPLPDLAQQQALARQVDLAFARANRLEAESARVRALLDRLEAAILTKAFRGELVPQDLSDEPASVLLDRIGAERAAAPKAKRTRRARDLQSAGAR